jgi:hypothetical protein
MDQSVPGRNGGYSGMEKRTLERELRDLRKETKKPTRGKEETGI